MHKSCYGVPTVYSRYEQQFLQGRKKMLVCAILYLETCLCIMLLTSLFILVSVSKQCRLTLKENLLNTNREYLGQHSASKFTQWPVTLIRLVVEGQLSLKLLHLCTGIMIWLPSYNQYFYSSGQGQAFKYQNMQHSTSLHKNSQRKLNAFALIKKKHTHPYLIFHFNNYLYLVQQPLLIVGSSAKQRLLERRKPVDTYCISKDVNICNNFFQVTQ